MVISAMPALNYLPLKSVTGAEQVKPPWPSISRKMRYGIPRIWVNYFT